jgi:hemolysin activation/secretion protein
LGLSGVVIAAAPAFAQLAQNPLPTSLPNVPQQSPLTHITPVTPPNLGAGLPNFGATGPEGALPSAEIPVQSVSIIGATAFPPEALNAATRGLAQHQVPLSQIEAARRALVELYRGHGFVLTTVSLDIDAQGNVRFIVTEGRIVSVKLSQDIGPAGTMVLKFLDHLTQERPVSEASLERWLLLAQQIPGVSVHAVLQAEAGDPGALTLVAEVSKQEVSALLTADNRSFQDTGPAEGLLVLDANAQTSLGDQTEVSIFHTSGGTDNFGQAACCAKLPITATSPSSAANSHIRCCSSATRRSP